MSSSVRWFDRTIRLGIAFLALLIIVETATAQTPVTAGFRDFSFGTTGTPAPTGEKPESKLWWNDGFWWGSLYNASAQKYHIYRLNLNTQTWVDQGTLIDDRKSTKADCLWDDETHKLYVASHIFTTDGAASNTSSNWGRLYRFSYDSGSKTYTLDPGFPVAITRGISETLVLAKDSTGMLWVTYVQNSKVMVNHSTTSDANWGLPYILPVGSTYTNLTSDDISSVIAFGGDRIGLMWSNQSTKKDYFSVHFDGDADNDWSSPEIALPTSSSNSPWSDDHINLKTDSSGRVYAAVKTSFTDGTQPLIVLIVRSTAGIWDQYTFCLEDDDHTRPIVVLDEAHNKLYVVSTSPTGGGAIYYKTSSMSAISFAAGQGTAVIKSSSDDSINNVTSMKQNPSSTTGIVVLASDSSTHYYLHNFLPIGGGSSPTITSFSPTSGSAGTQVGIQGSGFTGTTAVSFNGSSASAFTVNSSTSLSATVPAGATTGKISVVTPNGTAVSTDDFVVPTAPAISSFSPIAGNVGTTVTINGSGFTGTSAVTFNTTNASSFNLVSDVKLTASVPTGATTGPISVTNGVGTGTSASQFTVTSGSSQTLTFVAGGDSYTDSSNATKNYGTSTVLHARQGTASVPTIYNSYLKFSVSGLGSSTVVAAKLRLYVTTGTPNTTNANAVVDFWTETGITWNSAPTAGSFVGSIGAAATGTWMEIAVDPSLFTGDANYDFELSASGTGTSVVWSSREGAHPPQLVLTTQ